MDQKKEAVLALVPAIRMIMSEHDLKSGSFVRLDQLNESDPEKITIRLGRTISVFRGEPQKVLQQIESAKADIGEYVFIEELGLLGLSSNKSKVEQKLATVRKESRGADLPEPVARPAAALLPAALLVAAPAAAAPLVAAARPVVATGRQRAR